MNNKEQSLDDDNLSQEAREQQVWDRLQNEAVAAQRWRLEQEMEQARKKAAAESGQDEPANLTRTKRLTVVALASFILITLLVAVVYAW